MVTYTVHRYLVDSYGRTQGTPIATRVWTKELADSYRGQHFVSKIVEHDNGKSSVYWENYRG